MVIVPYIVTLVVALLFFMLCGILIFGWPKRKSSVSSGKVRPVRREHKQKTVKKSVPDETVKLSPRKAYHDETTQIISLKQVAEAQDNEKTRVFGHSEFSAGMSKQVPKREKSFDFAEEEPVILKNPATIEELEQHFVRHFLNAYGAVSSTVEQDAKTVTKYVIQEMHMNAEEAADTLLHIMVQEALQNAQRAYVMMPNDMVLHMVAEAFCDVAHGRRSETRTILAYDALKAMPRMEENQFHALSLLLLFHYSRNTDNVNLETFRAYTKKYVSPFINELPDEYSGYQQLEYIHCLSLDNREMPFGRVLHDSYPLLFAYRGFMKSEVMKVREKWKPGTLVHSLYNSYYKLAVVDDSLLSDFYSDIGISSSEDRMYLTNLVHSRPVEYDRKELSHILNEISPDLGKMQEIWDTSLLRRATLTLMGMYMAKICIRSTIGEDFDLSHWM